MKYLSIVKFDIKRRWKSLVILSLILFIFLVMIGSAYSTIAPQYAAIFENAPPAFEAILGESANIGSPAGFLNAEMFSIMIPLMLAIASIGYGSGAIGSEIENGQIELLLSRNVSRLGMAFSKITTLFILNFGLGLVTWISIALSTILFDFDVSLTGAGWATLSAILLSLVFGSFAFLLSVIVGRKDLALGATTGVFAIMYVWQALANVITNIKKFDFLTVFKFYEPGSLLMGDLKSAGLLIMALATIIILLLSLLIFTRKDINIQ